ncbi:MAG: glycogen synthase [Spirochaetia bacterium]
MSTTKYKILMITGELSPFAKTGAPADTIAALSVELMKQGHDVRVVMPRYYHISKKDKKKRSGILGVHMGYREEWCAVYTGHIPHSDVPVYFLDHEQYFGRYGLYGPSLSTDYDDNAERFAFLSYASFHLCRMLEWIPNIMHAHDWQSSMVPVYLYTKERDGDFFHTASVLTIHDIAKQGWFKKEDYQATGLPAEDIHLSKMEKEGKLNFLHAGICQADVITTLGPTYAHEIQTEAVGAGLHDVINRRKEDIFGVLNGADYRVWNPVKDKLIAPLNFKNPSAKIRAKKYLQKEYGFIANPKIPLLLMVGPITKEKGFELLLSVEHPQLMQVCQNMDIQVMILGQGGGDISYETELDRLTKMLPNLKIFLEADETLIHMAIAGSDFLLMPSLHEPSSLTQIYALRYGTIPIVHPVGTLIDTVKDYDEGTAIGTGFICEISNSRSIYQRVHDAIKIYNEKPKVMLSIQKQAMSEDFSGARSAEKYTQIYEDALANREGKKNRSW